MPPFKEESEENHCTRWQKILFIVCLSVTLKYLDIWQMEKEETNFNKTQFLFQWQMSLVKY